jgi:hypothetical protein
MPQQEFDLLEIAAVFSDTAWRTSDGGRGLQSGRFQSAAMSVQLLTRSLRVSRLIFPLFETDRSRRPSLISAAAIQRSILFFTQTGMATVRICRPFPSRSTRTHRPLFAEWSRGRARPTRSAGGRSRAKGPGSHSRASLSGELAFAQETAVLDLRFEGRDSRACYLQIEQA